MAVELLSTADAQVLFDHLPERDRIPTLRPDVLAAAAADFADGMLLHLLATDSSGLILNSVIERAIPGTDRCDWMDPYNYGGILLTGDREPARWTGIEAHARDRGVVAEFHRFHPLGDGRLVRAPVARFDRLTVAIPLDADFDAGTHFKPSAIGALKKAVNSGVEVRETRVGESRFGNRYRELMLAKNARPELVYDDAYFRRLESTGTTRLLEAIRGDEVLGSILILQGPHVSEYHLGESSSEGRSLGVTNLLLASAARMLGELDCRWLFLGGGTDGDPRNGLLRFKTSLSGSTFDFWIGGTVYDERTFHALPEVTPSRFLRYRE